MQDFRKLKVWAKAHELALDIYRTSMEFPPEERYGLTAQVRRAAVSVPSNIVEGTSRGTDADLARFIQIAIGSASEAEYQLLLARDLVFLHEEHNERLGQATVEVRRMLIALLATLRRSPAASRSRLTAHGS